MNTAKIIATIISLSIILSGCNSSGAGSSSNSNQISGNLYDSNLYPPLENSTDYTGTWVIITATQTPSQTNDYSVGTSAIREFVQITKEGNQYFLSRCLREHDKSLLIENEQMAFSGHELIGQNKNYFYSSNAESEGLLSMTKVSNSTEPFGLLTIKSGNTAEQTFPLSAVCYDFRVTNEENSGHSETVSERIFGIKNSDPDEIGLLSNVHLVNTKTSAGASSRIELRYIEDMSSGSPAYETYLENLEINFTTDEYDRIEGEALWPKGNWIKVSVDLNY